MNNKKKLESKENFASRAIETNQQSVHENLRTVVKKHLQSPDRTPVRPHNLIAFEALQKKITRHNYSALIMDSCCGTGLSSITLAEQNSDALVIGIDQSSHRLSKREQSAQPENCIFLRANCEDIWRLCLKNNIRFDSHYLLYPNPYPKSKHLQRRWHGHASFPLLPALANKTILRSNWKIYLEEFQIAWEIATGNVSQIEKVTGVPEMTLFERKYRESGQALYEIICTSQQTK